MVPARSSRLIPPSQLVWLALPQEDNDHEIRPRGLLCRSPDLGSVHRGGLGANGHRVRHRDRQHGCSGERRRCARRRHHDSRAHRRSRALRANRRARALLLGYKASVRPVTLEAGATLSLDIQLERSVIPVTGVEILVGSRARHTAADELAVPVDVFPAEELRRQGTTETSQVLQSLAPSVNFPHQSVTDATDIVRPFTLRGLSPDQTLVLVNGLRRHQTALVNTFAYGMPAGSSGVDLNAIPSSAIDHIEVLRDGAAAQYGSDAIAGVVNVVMRRGRFAPTLSVTGGEHFTADYPHDGKNLDANGAWGLPLGPGSLMLSFEYLDRDPTNRAWADTSEVAGTGLTDVINHDNGKVITKRNPVPQPNHHWGDGLERDVLSMADIHLPIPTLGGGQLYANASRELKLGLPKDVNVALGAAFRDGRWRIVRGELASYIDGGSLDQNGNDAPGGSQVFPGFAPSAESNSSRNNVGAYLDLESNLTRELLANAAARFEHYSDFGSLVTGKLAGRWQPTPRITVRAAGSTGFRAPGLGQIHFSKVVTNFIAGAPEEIGIFPVDHPAAKALGAKPLKEEKSVNLSAGLAVTPFENLTLTVDAYQIKIDDRILLGATFDDATTLSILASAGYGEVAGVQYFTNGLDTRTRGVDITGVLHMAMEKRGAIDWRASANYGKTAITHVDPLPAVLAGSSEPGLLDEVTRVAIEKERPDWRGTLSAEYTWDPVRALVRGSYYGVFASAQPAFTDGYTEHYPARSLLDAEAGYRVITGLEVAIGGRDLLDTYPGKAKLDFNNNFDVFPWAAASPFGYNGRFVYFKTTWTMQTWR